MQPTLIVQIQKWLEGPFILDKGCPETLELREDSGRGALQSDDHIRLRWDQLDERLDGGRIEDVQSAA